MRKDEYDPEPGPKSQKIDPRIRIRILRIRNAGYEKTVFFNAPVLVEKTVYNRNKSNDVDIGKEKFSFKIAKKRIEDLTNMVWIRNTSVNYLCT